MILKQLEQKIMMCHHHQGKVVNPHLHLRDHQDIFPNKMTILVQVGSPKANPKQRKHPQIYPKAIPSLSEEDLDYQQHRRSVEKSLGLALNGQTYANTEFVKALSSDVSTSFTQLMKKEEVIHSISDKEKEKEEEEEKREFVEYIWFYTFLCYGMFIVKERLVTQKKRLYCHNVVNYVTIKKCMILYWEILVWYMENYVAVMKQFVDDLIANSALQNPYPKRPHTGSFGLEDVMETIEDLVLMEQRYLGQSQFEDEEYEGFQRDDRLYIYPPPGGGLDSKCAHVKFVDKPGALAKGLLELPGIGSMHPCITRFLQYVVGSQQEVHQWIFMEHVLCVYREIFVTDTELLCIDLEKRR
eukprot:jgi/Psemu1/26208/gm1.26208_g